MSLMPPALLAAGFALARGGADDMPSDAAES
jgi:hypothetical protein